eukprot:8667635-Alexandrium_andersonii.AAC.1
MTLSVTVTGRKDLRLSRRLLLLELRAWGASRGAARPVGTPRRIARVMPPLVLPLRPWLARWNRESALPAGPPPGGAGPRRH